MDNDVLQDNNGNIVNPDNNEVLDNEVEGGVNSGTVSPGTGPGTGGYEPGEGDKDITDKGDPILPGEGGGSDPGSGTDPEPEPGSGTVLTPEQKIPTNSEIQVSIRELAGRKYDFTEYYDWTDATPAQTGDYCPTRGQIQDNIQNDIKDPAKVLYWLTSTTPENQCPTAGELAGAITVNGTPIDPPGKPIPKP